MVKNQDNGFTLIEMLVVVLILGILSSIAVVSVIGITRNANVKSCETDWRSVSNAATAYINDNPGVALTKLELYSKNKDKTVNDLTGASLSGLGYMSPFSEPGSYKIKLGWTVTTAAAPSTAITSQTPVIDVYNGEGTALLNATATHSVADCAAIP